ncbi:GAF and ANTAR domain-containing protein [Amycolatopsis cihanbeyliensis]|uniref:GAF domain-containing protein n=1 Tax=Amycolatopsis cihanbeyliensis TaxID=1128664 RepID=A0A542DGQ6_AMYCI|nr:GAF and ANTAR domain-containing protein [Amycolatopsis cihanbeyliensis]TQJ02268.1 GAF domain-containing protein [Amycolatopsis cihanbeyliensis]
MAGFGGDRLPQVSAWVSERAAGLRTRVSMRLICETAVTRLGVSGAVVTMHNPAGWPETAESTGVLADRLAELEVTLGEGPCLDASRDGRPVLIADLHRPAGRARWPLFAPLAVEAGAGALFALPMCVGSIGVGVLALHRVVAGELGPVALADSLAFTELAMRLLLDERAGLLSENGEPATTNDLPLHNAQLHQATGMIAAQLEVGMGDAFAVLRARAFADRRLLADLAADVVTRRFRFER